MACPLHPSTATTLAIIPLADTLLEDDMTSYARGAFASLELC